MILKFIIPLHCIVVIYSYNIYVSIMLVNHITNNYLILNLINISMLYVNTKIYIILVNLNIYNILETYNSINFIQSFSYIPAVNLHFNFNGSWLFTRNKWPSLTSYSFGYSHPLSYNINGLYISLFSHYINYSGYIAICIDWNLLYEFIYCSCCISKFNVYNSRGMKYASSRLLLKSGINVKSIN